MIASAAADCAGSTITADQRSRSGFPPLGDGIAAQSSGPSSAARGRASRSISAATIALRAPNRGMKLDLGDERRTDHDRARQEHDEDRRSVTGIDKLIIEPARIAARPQCQKALKQLALAAARAGAGHARENSGG